MNNKWIINERNSERRTTESRLYSPRICRLMVHPRAKSDIFWSVGSSSREKVVYTRATTIYTAIDMFNGNNSNSRVSKREREEKEENEEMP